LECPALVAAVLNEFDPSELSTMPKEKSTAGPMRTQPIERAPIFATPVLPIVPRVGKMKKAQPKKKPTRAEDVRAAKAKITRRNSLRKQRKALQG
jgi:hypothetical protein